MRQPDSALIRLKLVTGEYEFCSAACQRPAVFYRHEANILFETGEFGVEQIGNDDADSSLILVTALQDTDGYKLHAVLRVSEASIDGYLQVISIQPEPLEVPTSTLDQPESENFVTDLSDIDF